MRVPDKFTFGVGQLRETGTDAWQYDTGKVIEAKLPIPDLFPGDASFVPGIINESKTADRNARILAKYEDITPLTYSNAPGGTNVYPGVRPAPSQVVELGQAAEQYTMAYKVALLAVIGAAGVGIAYGGSKIKKQPWNMIVSYVGAGVAAYSVASIAAKLLYAD